MTGEGCDFQLMSHLKVTSPLATIFTIAWERCRHYVYKFFARRKLIKINVIRQRDETDQPTFVQSTRRTQRKLGSELVHESIN